jgi:hypothetical protein
MDTIVLILSNPKPHNFCFFLISMARSRCTRRFCVCVKPAGHHCGFGLVPGTIDPILLPPKFLGLFWNSAALSLDTVLLEWKLFCCLKFWICSLLFALDTTSPSPPLAELQCWDMTLEESAQLLCMSSITDCRLVVLAATRVIFSEFFYTSRSEPCKLPFSAILFFSNALVPCWHCGVLLPSSLGPMTSFWSESELDLTTII